MFRITLANVIQIFEFRFNFHFEKKSGFTIVEVIIVIGIFSLGLLMIAKVFPLGFKAKQKAEYYSISTILGQKLMEEIKKEGYRKLNSDYPFITSDYGRGKGKFSSYSDFSWKVEWWQTKISNLRKVKVEILHRSCPEESRASPCLELVTYIAKRE